jgi:hypothetical protein
MFYTNIDVHSQVVTQERVETCWSSSVVIVKTLYCNMVHLLEYSVVHVPFHVHMVCCKFLTLIVL